MINQELINQDLYQRPTFIRLIILKDKPTNYMTVCFNYLIILNRMVWNKIINKFHGPFWININSKIMIKTERDR